MVIRSEPPARASWPRCSPASKPRTASSASRSCASATACPPQPSSSVSEMVIQERTFLVTGGGSGLGGAVAHNLTKAGANVVVADLKGEEAVENSRFVETDV